MAPPGTRLEVLGTEADWLEIRNGDSTAWLAEHLTRAGSAASAVAPPAPPAPEAAVSESTAPSREAADPEGTAPGREAGDVLPDF